MGHGLGFAICFEHTLSLSDQCHKWTWFPPGIQRYIYIYVYIKRYTVVTERTNFPSM